MPNPPWITGPHLLPAEQPRDLFESKNKDDREDTSHGYLTDKVRGGRGWRAMRSIVASITRLRDTRPLDAAADVAEEAPDFSIHLEHASRSRRAPWTKAEEKIVFPREKKAKLVTAAELTLPEPLLLRLRGEAREMTKWVKAKKAGVTQDVVNGIKMAWRRSELAMVKIVDPLCRNMDRAREIVELKKKIRYSEAALANLSSSWTTSEQVADQELLTEEERQTFLKIGLKMDAFLLLGRRGIYDGIIGSIHQHWKHREVVNVITMQKSFQQIMYTAKLLEVASGGILVGVEKQRKGHAMIFYRGKNYSRPLKLLPENFLTKKQALQRSIEIQRRGSLKYFAYRRHLSVLELKQRLVR